MARMYTQHTNLVITSVTHRERRPHSEMCHLLLHSFHQIPAQVAASISQYLGNRSTWKPTVKENLPPSSTNIVLSEGYALLCWYRSNPLILVTTYFKILINTAFNDVVVQWYLSFKEAKPRKAVWHSSTPLVCHRPPTHWLLNMISTENEP